MSEYDYFDELPEWSGQTDDDLEESDDEEERLGGISALFFYMAPMLERVKLTMELEQFLEEVRLEETEHGAAYLERLWFMSPEYAQEEAESPLELREILTNRTQFMEIREKLSGEIGATKVRELEHHLGLNPQHIDMWAEEELSVDPFEHIDESRTSDVLMYLVQKIMAETEEDLDDELDDESDDEFTDEEDSIESLDELLQEDEPDTFGNSPEWGDLGEPQY